MNDLCCSSILASANAASERVCDGPTCGTTALITPTPLWHWRANSGPESTASSTVCRIGTPIDRHCFGQVASPMAPEPRRLQTQLARQRWSWPPDSAVPVRTTQPAPPTPQDLQITWCQQLKRFTSLRLCSTSTHANPVRKSSSKQSHEGQYR
eukprot:1162834-Alexandrium_andersonii.AAC.1